MIYSNDLDRLVRFDLCLSANDNDNNSNKKVGKVNSSNDDGDESSD
jgi:hypothetical protein